MIGRYARVRMSSGALLTAGMMQATPLVVPGSAVVSVASVAGLLPAGLRERSQVEVVFPLDTSTGGAIATSPVMARVVGLPSSPDTVSGKVTLSLELTLADAVVVAQAPSVRIVLLDPGVDPANAAGAG